MTPIDKKESWPRSEFYDPSTYSRKKASEAKKKIMMLSPSSFTAVVQFIYGPGFDTRSGNILSFLLPLFQEGQLSVTGESM